MGIRPIGAIDMNMVHNLSASIISRRMRQYGLTLKEVCNLMSFKELVDLESKLAQDIVRRNLTSNHTNKIITNSTKFNLRGFEAIA